MQLTRTRELTVRMGDYESFKFSATVTATHHDLGYSDDDLAGKHDQAVDALQAFVSDQIDIALQTDMEDAADLTGDRKSFIRRAFASTPASTTATATTNRK